MYRAFLLSGVLALSAAAPAAAPKAAAGLTSVQSGGEAALLLDGQVMARPFGGTLVDRLTVAGRYPMGGGRTVWLVRGDGGEHCASQYIVVDQAAKQQPDISSVFGCDAVASGRVQRGELRVSLQADGMAPSELAWRRGMLEPADPVAAAQQANLACANPAATPGVTEAALAEALPANLRRRRDLRRAVMTDAELEQRMADLACLATWPGGDRAVPDAATPLFVSKTWGNAALAALDRIAVKPGSPQDLRAAARLLSGRMRYIVGAREPIV